MTKQEKKHARCPICKCTTEHETILTGHNRCYAKYKLKCLVCGITDIKAVPKPKPEY